MAYLEEQNITGYIPNFGQYKPSRAGFNYNKEQDRYECIQEGGNQAMLPYRGTDTDALDYTKKKYRSSQTDCLKCPLKEKCIGKAGKYKKIEDSIYKPHYDKMHQRLQSNYAKRMKKLRSSTVEPVLGTLINFTAMRRIWTIGIKQANKFMLCAAIAYNLKKLMKFKEKTVKVIPMALQLPKSEEQSPKKLCFLFFNAPQQLYIFLH